MSHIYCFADVRVGVESVHAAVHGLGADYAADGPAAFTVRTAQRDIDAERSRAERPGFSDAYLETLAVCRGIAERLPFYDAFLFHGSAVAVDGEAYLFTARSGTGKSTHTRLWRELLGARAVMVNDDKPWVRVTGERAVVYGSPWDGKHHLSRNIAVPLRAVCILERAAENTIRPVSGTDALATLLQQIYRPADPAALERTLELIDRLCGRVSLYRLGCNMDIGAAELSWRIMRGEQAE